ncbi:MAG: hypothetical protein M3Q46_05590 [Verrucomicrobiota bacterium]|nr:hypothetical protein [Verrucomicrobiota bacterium]
MIWARIFAVSLGGLATGGAVLRLRCEEHLLSQAYPEYGDYSRGTSRLLAGVW